MKKLILVTAFAVSFQSFAATTFEIPGNTQVYTPEAPTRAEAYEIGVETLQGLKQLTGKQAYQKLNLFNSKIVKKSVKVKGGRVFVDEFVDDSGSLKYQARVKLTYSYNESGSNR